MACRRRCRSHLCKMSMPFKSLAYCQKCSVNVSPLLPGSASNCQISYVYVCFTGMRFTTPLGFRGDPLYQIAAIISGRQGQAVPLNNFTCHGQILQLVPTPSIPNVLGWTHTTFLHAGSAPHALKRWIYCTQERLLLLIPNLVLTITC